MLNFNRLSSLETLIIFNNHIKSRLCQWGGGGGGYGNWYGNSAWTLGFFAWVSLFLDSTTVLLFGLQSTTKFI